MRENRPVLQAGYMVLALRVQEAMQADLTSSDVRQRLSDAIADQVRGSGNWAYYIDHTGDGETGDVIYSCNSDTFRAPYSISGTPAAAKCVIDFDNAEDVVPRTIYEVEADEDTHYAAMGESFKAQKLYTELPLYERFISKNERDSAEAGDFAGKNKSFPILKAGDVAAAAHAIGRAGPENYSIAVLKANIIKIAKRKGWTAQLPKTWQGGADASEAATVEAGPLKLVEAATTIDRIVLREARADYPIKLIAAGKGSSAYYPADVLKRDGPTVFPKGTHVYLNHPTAAEEAARPEGDVANLAGVLTQNAYWDEAGKAGPGLYGAMKVFADHAATVEEKAPHVGMSIRAYGDVRKENGKAVMTEGRPEISRLTAAESVDVVTRAGAGGKILTEAARSAETNQEAEMTAEEVKQLIESSTAPLRQRALRGDAITEANRMVRDYRLPDRAKQRIVEAVISGTIPTTDKGELDVETFGKSLKAEAQREADYVASLTGAGQVRGMGTVAITEKKAQKDCPSCDGSGENGDGSDCDDCDGTGKVAKESRRADDGEKQLKEAEDVFTRLMGGNKNAAAKAARKGVAA